MHWNNRSILDGFIDEKNNMYQLNDEYDMRKSICEKLFDTYKMEDFKWSNQSYTSIAYSLFKQMDGYLPESTYNVNIRKMLDDIYPHALQWCTTGDIDEDAINIVVFKSYPNILLNNTQPIPVYSIHDVIEPFGCKSDLNKCGEFYIDEVILNNYGTDLKIEAVFYSSNLVSYLVDELNMSTTNVKYKITTKKNSRTRYFQRVHQIHFR